jgi:hypothetical protein
VFFVISLRVRLMMLCAKFGVDWSRNVGGVGKKQLAYAKRCSRLQCICVYKFLDCGRFGVGVIAPNAYSLV